MAQQEQTQKFCPSCNRNVLATRAGTSHILHLLLSIITAGLWIIIWILSSVKFGGWRCTVCGSTNLRSPKRVGEVATTGPHSVGMINPPAHQSMSPGKTVAIVILSLMAIGLVSFMLDQ